MMGRIRNLVKLREPTIMDAETQQRPPRPRQSKKQARRRLHASKPYQERLLNMAEARKEIAAALRFHRAAMKHQQNQPSEEPPPPPPPPPPQPVPTRIYYSRYICKHPFPCSSPPRPYPLPNHPLCPKCNMETAPMPSAETCLSPAAESKPAIETPTLDSTLHPAMGDEEMEEIRSVGERHDWEWNDSVNLLTSALWSRFLETVDGKGEAFRALGEAIDIPTWLSDGSGMDHHMDDHLHVVSFPWL